MKRTFYSRFKGTRDTRNGTAGGNDAAHCPGPEIEPNRFPSSGGRLDVFPP